MKRFFYSEQKGALNQPFAKPHPEISPENKGPATGTFGMEIKGRPRSATAPFSRLKSPKYLRIGSQRAHEVDNRARVAADDRALSSSR